MSQEPHWIDGSALRYLHSESLAIFGGSTGLRDETLLESALARPQNLFAYGEDVSLHALAASYCFGLVKNHAFIDGNKRVAFLSIGLFLGLNGLRLVADQLDAINTVLAVASSEMSEADLVVWVEQNSKPAD